jgi:hypothetical protein
LKRPATEVLRRSLENTLANWPLLALRLAESLVFLALVVVAIIALIVPLAVSAGLGNFPKIEPDEIMKMLPALFFDHLLFIAYVLGMVLVVGTIFMVTHSAIEAGSAAVYLDGERAGSLSRSTKMERFDTFTLDTWWSGVRRGWWTVFWIYNIAWSAAALVILAPVLIAAVGSLLLSTASVAAAIGIGCLGLLLTILVLLVTSVVTNVWVKKATVLALSGSPTAREALRESWREGRADPGRQLTVAVILIVVAVGGSGVISMMSAGISFGHSLTWQVLMSPVRLVSSLLNAAFSAMMSGWFLAAFASFTAEGKFKN